LLEQFLCKPVAESVKQTSSNSFSNAKHF